MVDGAAIGGGAGEHEGGRGGEGGNDAIRESDGVGGGV